jgi:hypothetical protein
LSCAAAERMPTANSPVWQVHGISWDAGICGLGGMCRRHAILAFITNVWPVAGCCARAGLMPVSMGCRTSGAFGSVISQFSVLRRTEHSVAQSFLRSFAAALSNIPRLGPLCCCRLPCPLILCMIWFLTWGNRCDAEQFMPARQSCRWPTRLWLCTLGVWS